VADCEELVGPPDRRDSKPRSPMQAEIRLTTLCIDGRGLGTCEPPAPAFGSGVHLNQTEIKLSKREVLLSGECNSTQIV